MPNNKNYISLYNMLKRAADRRQPREAARLAKRQLRNPEKYGNVDLSLQMGMSDSKKHEE